MTITVTVRLAMSGEHHRLGYREQVRTFTGDEFDYGIDDNGILFIYEGDRPVASYAVGSWSSVQAERN